MKNIISVLLLIVLINASLSAQNFAEDLVKIRQTYESQDNWHISMVTKYWSTNPSDSKPFEYTSVIKKKGDYMRMDTDELTIFSNDKYMVTCQKTNKVLACQKHDALSLKQQHPVPAITALLDIEGQEIIYKGVLDQQQLYVIKNEKSRTPTIEFYFDENTYRMTKLVYHYQENDPEEVNKVEIAMQYLNTSKGLSTANFSEKQFLRIDPNHKVSLLDKYQDYTLVLGDGLDYK